MLLLTGLCTINLPAQITLLHTFEGNVNPSTWGSDLSQVSYFYKYDTNKITIYDTNLALYKEVRPNLPENFSLLSATSLGYNTVAIDKIGFYVWLHNDTASMEIQNLG